MYSLTDQPERHSKLSEFHSKLSEFEIKNAP